MILYSPIFDSIRIPSRILKNTSKSYCHQKPVINSEGTNFPIFTEQNSYEKSIRARYKAARANLTIPPANSMTGVAKAVMGFDKPTPKPKPIWRTASAKIAREELLAANLLSKPYTIDYKISLILRSVAKKHKTTVNQIKSKRRNKPDVIARQEAIWRIYTKTPISMTRLGRLLNRDHTTILHSVRKHEARMKEIR